MRKYNLVRLILAPNIMNGRFVGITIADFHVPASVGHCPRLCIENRRVLVSEDARNKVSGER